MTTEVHIVLANAKNVLVAPVSALRDAKVENKAMVRVVTADDKIEERTVETGITDRINTEIRSGLNEGDKIVIDNQSAPAGPTGM